MAALPASCVLRQRNLFRTSRGLCRAEHLDCAGVADSGIVDQNVDCARLLQNLRHAFAHAVILVDVELDGDDVLVGLHHFGLAHSGEDTISVAGEGKWGFRPGSSAGSGHTSWRPPTK